VIYSQAFIRAVNFVLDPTIEGAGKLSMDPKDPGNWTGGAQGKGDLRGTKWGISAKSYPALDIASLSREQAVALYNKDFWAVIGGDDLPPRAALAVFDSAVNQGVDAAVRLLQVALGIVVDGELGPQTRAAARNLEQDKLINYFLAQRALRYTQSKDFGVYGKGWMRRLFSLCAEASR
jgi:lysozyme family protein